MYWKIMMYVEKAERNHSTGYCVGLVAVWGGTKDVENKRENEGEYIVEDEIYKWFRWLGDYVFDW